LTEETRQLDAKNDNDIDDDEIIEKSAEELMNTNYLARLEESKKRKRQEGDEDEEAEAKPASEKVFIVFSVLNLRLCI